MKRMQSPSSINTYMQCPRKYFFIYNLKLHTKPSIHLVRGSVVHSALEDFFTIMPEMLGDRYRDSLQEVLLKLLKKHWQNAGPQFGKLKLSPEEVHMFLEESQLMIVNWVNQFCDKIDFYVKKGLAFPDAFAKLTPITEKEYRDEDLQVRGFIDAIEEIDGITRLMDYKTSKKAEINEDYKRQLGIYAMMYEKKHGKKPSKVGIYFLKESEQTLDVTDELINEAKFMIEQIHFATENSDRIDEYPKKESPLCNWGRGQCDFYEYCFQNKEIPSIDRN